MTTIETTKTHKGTKKDAHPTTSIKEFITPAQKMQVIQIFKGKTFHQVEVPTQALEIMEKAIESLAAGQQVRLIVGKEILSTQQAADLLDVSRSYLIALL